MDFLTLYYTKLSASISTSRLAFDRDFVSS